MFRRIIILCSAALAASVLLPYQAREAARPRTARAKLLSVLGCCHILVSGCRWCVARRGHQLESARGLNNRGDIVGLACWSAGRTAGEPWEVFLSTEQADGTRLTRTSMMSLAARFHLIGASLMRETSTISDRSWACRVPS